ncbi:MAG: hypothetical protein JWQ06_2276 [Mucilaginibacter sp.]|nr:hypothetical protein [Mucilaginibacter sp.]
MPLPKQESSEQETQTIIVSELEKERLRKDVFRPDMEKFQLFTSMLRTNKMYNGVKVTHK